MTQYPHNISMNFYYTWNFQIVLGYNNIILPQPVVVSKGYFIQLTQGTGRVAIDITGNATYSDLVWNTTQQWTKLAEFSNRRFYLTPLFNFTSYQNTLNVLHSYANIGLYTLSLTFLSSNKTFQQIINVTDCNLKFSLIFNFIFNWI
jgi:hypothetical protein